MVPGGSSPRSTQPSTYPSPWPDESVHDPEPFSWRSILILFFHLQLGLRNGLFACVHHFSLPHTCYTPQPILYSQTDHSNMLVTNPDHADHHYVSSSSSLWASSPLGPRIFLSTLLPTPSAHARSSKRDTKFHTQPTGTSTFPQTYRTLRFCRAGHRSSERKQCYESLRSNFANNYMEGGTGYQNERGPRRVNSASVLAQLTSAS